MAETQFSIDVRPMLAEFEALGEPQIIAFISEARSMMYPGGDINLTGNNPVEINRAKNQGQKFLRRLETRFEALSRQPNNPSAKFAAGAIAQINAIQRRASANEQGYFSPVEGTGGLMGISWYWLAAGAAGVYLLTSKKGRKWLKG